MFAYIEGIITYKTPTFLYLENGGIGYHINISLATFNEIQHLDKCKLYTYTNIKKDGQSIAAFELYGFYHKQEQVMFELLISVSGIGSNTARVMLSSMSNDEISQAILTENEKAISSIKGIGPKTAKRVILELKDKVAKTADGIAPVISSNMKIKEEALLALTLLGFNKNTASNAIEAVCKGGQQENVESVIKSALKIL